MSLIPNQAGGLSHGNADFDRLLQNALAKPLKQHLYTAQITRKTPTAFLFMIDQSGSMSEKIKSPNGEMKPKSELAAEVLNGALAELLNKAINGVDIKHYYDICLLGYGGDKSGKSEILWEGGLQGAEWVSPEQLQQHPLFEFDFTEEKQLRGGKTIQHTIKRKAWLKTKAAHLTYMGDALRTAKKLMEKWLVNRGSADCYPPTVINITDGASTDLTGAALLKAAAELTDLRTSDGNILFFNIHISGAGGQAVQFPSDKSELPNDEYARQLFDMSSEMPKSYLNDIKTLLNNDHDKPYVAMAYNASADSLISMISIGTSVAKNIGNTP